MSLPAGSEGGLDELLFVASLVRSESWLRSGREGRTFGRSGAVGRLEDQVTATQPGSRAKASTRSSAQGQVSAMRKVVHRAERTRTPAVCNRV